MTAPNSTPTLTPPSEADEANAQDEARVYSPPEPDISHLVLEDETPVDNLIQEKLQRLLVQCLYSAYTPGQPFLAMADIGIFFSLHQPPIVPDVMLSLGVEASPDWHEKQHRSYLVWEFGKVPEIVIEIVSNLKGNERGRKLTDYAQMGIGYYAVFDPLQHLSTQLLQTYVLHGSQYQPLTQPQFPSLGLGLTVWDGEFEGKQYDRWLRWCDLDGNLLLTGDEQAAQERQRAEAARHLAEVADEQAQQERQRAEQADERAQQERQRAEQADERAQQERQRAEQADERAQQERQRAEQERQRAEQLAAQLRALGIDPNA